MNITDQKNLGAYSGSKQRFSGFFGEAVWGHRFQQQPVWPLTLEFLCMVEGMLHKEALFDYTSPEIPVSYESIPSKELKILMFNNPRLRQILSENQDNNELAWNAWFEDMAKRIPEDLLPDFRYLSERIPVFANFVSHVELVRKLALESNTTGRKWTQRFLFPIGPAALYEPSETNFTRERNIFTRTGELAYLMISRAAEPLRNELKSRFSEFFAPNTSRNKLILNLLPSSQPKRDGTRGNGYLPYRTHPAFDRLAEDLLNLMKLDLPNQDVLEHLRLLLPFNLYLYALETANAWQKIDRPVTLVAEIPGPKMDVVRKASIAYRDQNESAGITALRAYIADVLQTKEEFVELLKPEALPNLSEEERARELATKLALEFDLEGNNPKQEIQKEETQTKKLLKATTRDEVLNLLSQLSDESYRDGLMPAILSLGTAAGLIDSRGTVKKRYAPTDSLLRSLVLANITNPTGRMEEKDFLALLHRRYGLVFAPIEATKSVLPEFEELYDEADFKKNHERFTRRLVGLGLANSMSDACTYVTNPFTRAGQL